MESNDAEPAVDDASGIDQQSILDVADQDERAARWAVLRVVGGAAVVAVIGLLVPLPLKGRAASAIGNLFHAPLFGSLAFIAFWAWNKLDPPETLTQPRLIRILVPVGRAILVAVSATLIGIGMEALQALTARTASWHDATANMLGATAGSIIGLVMIGWPRNDDSERRSRMGWSQGIGWFAAIVLVGAASYDSAATLLDVTRVRTDFPVLASFESDAELRRWYFRDCWRERSRQGVTAGKSSIRVNYDPSPNPAMTLIEMHSDWSEMQSVDFDVMVDPQSADDVVHLMVKVTDENHSGRHLDSFHQVFKIPRGGKRSISIKRQSLVDGPDGRRLDLASIRFLDLMLDRPDVPTVVYFDHVRVVR